MSRDFFRNRSSLGSIPQMPALAYVSPLITKVWDMAAQPPTSEMDFTNNATYFNGQWYCNPTDKSGLLKTNYYLGRFSEITLKAKITNCADTWLNLEAIQFLDSANATVMDLRSESGASGSNNGGFFKATSGSGWVTQAISNAWGTYYLEMTANANATTFKIYNSSQVLLYTLAGTYATGKSFNDIVKVAANIYSSSAGGAYMDDLTMIITPVLPAYTFYDDFVGTALNSVYWTGVGNYGVSAGRAYVNGIQGSSQITSVAEKRPLINQGMYVEWDASIPSTSMSYHGIGITNGTDNLDFMFRWETQNTLFVRVGTTYTSIQSGITVKSGIFRIEYAIGGAVRFYIDSVLVHTSSISGSNLYFSAFGCYDNGKQISIGYYKVGNL